jgi:protein-tyrosine-phosphatase
LKNAILAESAFLLFAYKLVSQSIKRAATSETVDTSQLPGEKRGGSFLFVCVHNAGRSQMAEAFAKGRGLKALSAGTVSASVMNPIVVQVMNEKGIDLSSSTPKLLTTEMINRATFVVTMGCSVEEVCPRPMLARMQKKLVDWKIEDPKGKTVEDVRKIRDEIEHKVAGL